MKEKKITKVVFETVDGQQFDTEEEAKEHEKNLFKDIFSLEGIAVILKEECQKRLNCANCPFYDNENFCCHLAKAPDRWIL